MDIKDFTMAMNMAITDELNRQPAFGCVNMISPGSHTDMDYRHFLKSARALSQGLENTKWQEIKKFDDLRQRGLEIEKLMFKATDNVNTHKGLIFLALILAYGLIHSSNFMETSRFIKDFTAPLKLDYDSNQRAQTYKNLSIKDVRSYPLTGYEEIFALAKTYEKEKLTDEMLTVFLLGEVDDTTTINRSNLATLRTLQARAREIFTAYKKGKNVSDEIYKLNSAYIEKNISSGGVADIFTLTKTIYYLRSIYE